MMMRQHCTVLVFGVCLAISAATFVASAADNQNAADTPTEPSPWYYFNGSTNNHPRLHAADRLTDAQLNRPFRLVAPGFEDVNTFTDQANNFMIWTPFIGAGRKLGNHWDVFFQGGGSAGRVRTQSDNISMVLLPFHADVAIDRSSLFIGPGLSWYPFGFAENSVGMSWRDRLGETKPFLFATVSYNRLTFEAKVKAGLKPLGNFIQRKQQDSWHPFSSAVGAGVDVPLTKRTTLALNAQYVFFYDYSEDFNGPSFAIFFKRSFNP